MHQPTTKDFAEYYRLALEAGLCRDTDIEAWADKMIVESEVEMPEWLLDLSTNGQTSKANQLGSVPGQADSQQVWNPFLAGLGRAVRLQKLTGEQVVRVLFRWAVNREIPEPFFYEAYRLDDSFDGICEGWNSESQFLKDFRDFFSQFRPFERFLPNAAASSLS